MDKGGTKKRTLASSEYMLRSKDMESGLPMELTAASEVSKVASKEAEGAEKEESVASGISDVTRSTVDYMGAGIETPSPNVMINMLLTLMQQSQDREIKLEEERRKARTEDLERMQRQRDEDIARMKEQLEQERVWQERMAIEKDKKDKLNQALRTFPKIATASSLPAQLHNYSKLLDSLGVEDSRKVDRLPEVLTGPMAVAFQNMKTEEGMAFSEVRKKLLAVAGLTATSAGCAFMKPDLDQLCKLSGVEFVTHVRGLVDRLLMDASTYEQTVRALLVMFVNNVGTPNLVSAVAGCESNDIEE